MQRSGQAPETRLSTNNEDNFLTRRMRRMRSSAAMRDLLAETHLSVKDFICPVFVEEHAAERQPISALPGTYRETELTLTRAVKDAQTAGIPAVLLFGISKHKDNIGSDSLKKGGLLDRMISRAKDAAPDILVIADTCFCEYTDHGHCGPLNDQGDVDNDRTLENLALQALVAANAGADIIAPSGMMDGMVHTIRSALDQNGFSRSAIMSYAAKFASSFYGPFREAAGCSLGQSDGIIKTRDDRKTYQMNPANSDEAMREVALDLEEGADMVMVKPGLPYLDIIARIRREFNVPTFAYHVSGEFAMLKAAAEKGWLDYEIALTEQMLCFKRAGTTGIITYGAMDMAEILARR